MAIREPLSYRAFQVANGFGLTFLSFLTLYPILHVLAGSLSEGAALARHSGLLFWPAGGFSGDAYRAVFSNRDIFRGYGNTLLLIAFGTTYQVLMTSLGAYVLSRKRVLWKSAIMFVIVFTMFFNGGLIPFYLQIRGLGLRNSLVGLVLPFSINAYNLIIMRTSFQAIPDSLEESAKIDGANHWTILFRIILPLSLPVLAVMFLYHGVDIWNGWFWATLLINERGKYPLQVILREILIQSDPSAMGSGGSQSGADVVGISETVKFATIIVSTVPILLVYPFLQKYFAKGVLIGALKG
jgi:putative aldouronate transport system permease protein